MSRVRHHAAMETPYARAYSYALAFDDERWAVASGHAWDQLEALAAEHQRGERNWPETQKLLDQVVAVVTAEVKP